MTKRSNLGTPRSPSINSTLATVLKDLGELAEARNLLLQAYESLAARLGREHPTTRVVANNLNGLRAHVNELSEPFKVCGDDKCEFHTAAENICSGLAAMPHLRILTASLTRRLKTGGRVPPNRSSSKFPST